MIFLFWLLMGVGIALIVYAFSFPEKTETEEKKEKIQEIPRPRRELDAPELESHLTSLQDELERAKTESSAIHSEFQDVKKRELKLSEELLKQRKLYSITQADVERFKHENAEARDQLRKLKHREQELLMRLAQKDVLDREFKAGSHELQVLEKENEEMAGKIKELEECIKQLEKERQIQGSAVDESKKDEKQRLHAFNELEKLKVNQALAQKELQEELQKIKRKELELNASLLKQKELSQADKEKFKKLEQERAKLKEELAQKEEELEQHRARAQAKDESARGGYFSALERENEEMADRIRELEMHLKHLERDMWMERSAQDELTKEGMKAVSPSQPRTQEEKLKVDMKGRTRKIGELLLEYNFITKDILDKALEYQESVGGSITQYLIAYGYINDNQLAQCLSAQFGFPYLPLGSFDLPKEVVRLVPAEIVEKHLLVPVDRVGKVLTIAMVNPLDTKAIKDVETATGCEVQPFVAILSDIVRAIERYYKIVIADKVSTDKKMTPLLIDSESYKGFERRQAVRLKTKIDVHFPLQDTYKKTKTKDVSRHGLLFESDSALPIGTYVTLQIDLPKKVYPLPISVVVQVVRVVPLESNKFDIGAKIISVSREDLQAILKYAATHKE
ncbi:MAG: PilZ domain-containing protein [Candidatus Omnitrophota bacterium]|nr:MAG: PilZ domain-containing protein [Candidatus Omnitrophota bacterium]